MNLAEFERRRTCMDLAHEVELRASKQYHAKAYSLHHRAMGWAMALAGIIWVAWALTHFLVTERYAVLGPVLGGLAVVGSVLNAARQNRKQPLKVVREAVMEEEIAERGAEHVPGAGAAESYVLKAGLDAWLGRRLEPDALEIALGIAGEFEGSLEDLVHAARALS